ncbi:transducer, TlpC [Plastorhodobacter daqingensis]|uniref:Transducer, TlpC n=1 Tax=Plastorhodobacter daqingensis TaxID=1387281 RepID=A0ABW2UR03_9RHOB
MTALAQTMPHTAEATLRALAPTLRDTEAAFSSAGASLGTAVSDLNTLRNSFGRLDALLGPDQTAHFQHLTSETGRQTLLLREGFERFLQHSQDLRGAVGTMQSEVSELVATIRTISIVTLHARILGNALSSNRQRVETFTLGLTGLAAEATRIVEEVEDAMAGIVARADVMDTEALSLARELGGAVQPALAEIGTLSTAAEEDRLRLAEGNSALAARMETIFSEVAQIILSLQVGDATRQRLEHVQAVTAAAMDEGRSAGLRALLLDLADALAAGTQDRLTAELAAVSGRLLTVEDAATSAISTARTLYLDGPGQNMVAIGAMARRAAQVGQGLQRCSGHLKVMSAQAQQIGRHLDLIRSHEIRMRRIEDQVRLLGLNAVIVCAKLGQEGRALQEVSRQLRELTRLSGAVFARLHLRLEETERWAAAIGTDAVANLAQDLDHVAAGMNSLRTLLTSTDSALRDSGTMFGQTGRSLATALASGAATLGRYSRNLSGLASFRAQLKRLGPQPDFAPQPPEVGTADHDIVASLRMIYTMPEERQIHDRVVGAPAQPAAAEAPAAAPAIDDIFF